MLMWSSSVRLGSAAETSMEDPSLTSVCQDLSQSPEEVPQIRVPRHSGLVLCTVRSCVPHQRTPSRGLASHHPQGKSGRLLSLECVFNFFKVIKGKQSNQYTQRLRHLLSVPLQRTLLSLHRRSVQEQISSAFSLFREVPVTSVSTERRARDMTNCNLKTVVYAPESHSSFSLGSFQDWFSNKPGNIFPPPPTQI